MSLSGIPTSFFRAIRFQDPDKEALRKITAPEWERILSDWPAARIMTSYRLDHREVASDNLPNCVGQKIDQYLADTALRFEKIESAYSSVARRLEEAGADHVVIKGFSLFPGYTCCHASRPQGDIDLLCPPDLANRAQEVLSSLGYVPEPKEVECLKDQLPTMMPRSRWKPGPNPFDPEMPIAFEVHFRLWDEEFMRFPVPGLEEFWSRRTVRQIDDFAFAGLHPVDNLGCAALNVVRDLLQGMPSLEQVHSIARFLHTQSDDEAFWQSWHELHPPVMRRLEAITFRLASDWFGCEVSAEVRDEMDQLSDSIQVWFHNTSRAGLYPNTTQAKSGAWLHFLLLESFKDRIDVLRKTVFRVGHPPNVKNSDPDDDQPKRQLPARSFALACRKWVTYPQWVVSRSAVRVAKLPSFFNLGFRIWFSRFNLNKGFWSFFAADFFFDFGMFIFFVLYNLYLVDRGFKENVLGLIASATATGGVVGAIPAGMFAHRFGLRKALFTCLALVPLIFALRSLVTSENLLIALAFLGGAVMTIWAVCISPAIAQLTNDRSRPIGFSTLFSSGIAIGIFGGQVGGRLPGWVGSVTSSANAGDTKQIALLFACALTAVGLLPLSRIKFSAAPPMEKKIYPSGRFIRRYLAVIALWTLATDAFDPFFNVYFSQHLHMPVQEIGSLFSYAQLAQVICIMASPVVFQKFGMVEGIAYMQIAAAVALGVLATCSRAPAAALVYVGYMAFHWMTEPGMMLLLMNRVAPNERTGASALNFLVINIAGAVATAAAGAAFSKFGYPPVLVVTSIGALVAAFAFRAMLSEDNRVPQATLSSRITS
ncbi:MAG: MFS transporter [Acidobacteria bacterium]|nr:MFS transporter [Acidobacteriota bacterium]